MNATIPTTFTVGGRTYKLVSFHKEGKSSITCDTMVERAPELDANLGREDGEVILKHQDKIPQEFQGKLLVFTAWRSPSNPRYFAFLFWFGVRWYQYWRRLDDGWCDRDRLLVRVSVS